MGLNNDAAQLYSKLVDTPFLPLLFISKCIEQASFWMIGEASAISIGAMAILSVGSTILWLSIDEDFDILS